MVVTKPDPFYLEKMNSIVFGLIQEKGSETKFLLFLSHRPDRQHLRDKEAELGSSSVCAVVGSPFHGERTKGCGIA